MSKPLRRTWVYSRHGYGVLQPALGRKKLKDSKVSVGENEISDLFLTSSGCEIIMNIYTTEYPKDLGGFDIRRNFENYKKKFPI